MFSLRKPSAESIRRFLTAQSKLPFTYSAVGATADALSVPSPFAENRGLILDPNFLPFVRGGQGGSRRSLCSEKSFCLALSHLFQSPAMTSITPASCSAKASWYSIRHEPRCMRWQQFHLGWVEAWPPDTPIQPGEVVAVLGRALGLWWVNAARIIYIVDDPGPIPRFGFAYGTLPGHVESGEERFLIEWDPGDNRVWYDILAFSKPNHILTRLGYPIVRRIQKRFARDSAASMLQAVRSGDNVSPPGFQQRGGN